MRVAVTGTSRIPGDPFATEPLEIIRDAVADYLMLCPERPTEFRTGAAFGVDTHAAMFGLMLWPKLRHVLFVPKGMKHNESLVTLFTKRMFSAEEPCSVRLIAGGYMARNDALVQGVDLLLAFPAQRAEVLRSGTWSTVRRARKVGAVVAVFPLDGSKPYVEGER